MGVGGMSDGGWEEVMGKTGKGGVKSGGKGEVGGEWIEVMGRTGWEW